MKARSISNRTFVSVIFSLFVFTAKAGSEWSADFTGGAQAFIENKGQFHPHMRGGISAPVLYAVDQSSVRILFTTKGVCFSFVEKLPKDKAEQESEHFSSAKDYIEKEKEEKAAVLKIAELNYQWENADPNVQLIAEDKSD